MEEYSTVVVYAGMCRAATQRKAARPEGHYDLLDAVKKQRRRRMELGLNSRQRSVDDEVSPKSAFSRAQHESADIPLLHSDGNSMHVRGSGGGLMCHNEGRW